MAKAVEQGSKNASNVTVIVTYHARPEDLQRADAIIVGAPTYNHNVTIDIQSLLEKTAQSNISLKDKIVAAFGSYGWSGEAPKQVLEIFKNKFQAQIIEPPILAQYQPTEKILQQCRELGKKVAEAIQKA